LLNTISRSEAPLSAGTAVNPNLFTSIPAIVKFVLFYVIAPPFSSSIFFTGSILHMTKNAINQNLTFYLT
jgi:hypothetical protein